MMENSELVEAITDLRKHCNKEIEHLNREGPNTPHFRRVNDLLKSCDKVFAALAALTPAPKVDVELLGLLREAEVKLRDVQGAFASKSYACNLLTRIDAALASLKESSDVE